LQIDFVQAEQRFWLTALQRRRGALVACGRYNRR
jgi:hypothetical protein